MFTKPLNRQAVTTMHISKDMEALRRLLTAAAINAGFCAKLLKSPIAAVQDGFGGEKFMVEDATLMVLNTIRASSLPEFIQELNTGLSNRLL